MTFELGNKKISLINNKNVGVCSKWGFELPKNPYRNFPSPFILFPRQGGEGQGGDA